MSITILIHITLCRAPPTSEGEDGGINKYTLYFNSDDKKHD